MNFLRAIKNVQIRPKMPVLTSNQNATFSTTATSLRKKRVPTKTAHTKMGESGMAIFYKIHKLPEFKNQWIENNKNDFKNLTDDQISRKYDLHLSTTYKSLSPDERKQYDNKALDFGDFMLEKNLAYAKREQDFADKNMAEASEKLGRKYSQMENEDGVITGGKITEALRASAEEGDENRDIGYSKHDRFG